ncbi:MAG: hypothetical protein ACYS1A_11670 [Planctomycetota bacterium]|jgi:hypothetical protein
MSQRKTLKLVHFGGTFWFILCVGYILALTLRQAGFHWWVIFSLSGHSALLIFLLISLYLFAIFRGAGRSQKIEAEHPLTSTNQYTVFYLITPVLGGLAGWLGMIGTDTVGQFLMGIALGTFGTTFLVWVILDPVTGMLEIVLPVSRKHRAERLVQAKAQKEQRLKNRKRLIAEIMAREEQDRDRWQRILQPEAEKLAGLLIADRSDFIKKRAERKAVDIGVNAWQIGGLSCMQQLHDMTMNLCQKKHKELTVIDYVSSWWDGVGRWQNPSLG